MSRLVLLPHAYEDWYEIAGLVGPCTVGSLKINGTTHYLPAPLTLRPGEHIVAQRYGKSFEARAARWVKE